MSKDFNDFLSYVENQNTPIKGFQQTVNPLDQNDMQTFFDNLNAYNFKMSGILLKNYHDWLFANFDIVPKNEAD